MQRIYLTLFLAASFLASRAQISPPHPTVPSASLATTKQSIEVSNDLYNGRLSISIPLYHLEFEGISFPLSLSYAGGSGIKPDELPSWVGLGWNLQAGGSVHRTVRGRPDEVRDFQTIIHNYFDPNAASPKKETILWPTDYSYFSNVNRLTATNWHTQAYANTMAPSQANISYSLSNQFETQSYYNHHPVYDLVPDEFTFSFANISGKFYLNQQNKWVVQSNDGKAYTVEVFTGPQTVVDYSVPQTGGRVFYQAPRIIKYFVIKSSSGVKYYFGNTDMNAHFNNQQFEFSHSSSVYPQDPNPHPPYQFVSGHTAPTYVDLVPHTWHLTKIENLKTGSTVTFNYKWGWQFYKTRQAWGAGGTGVTGDYMIHDNSIFHSNPDDLNSWFRLSALTKVLTKSWTVESIVFSNGTKIEFNSAPSTQLSTNNYVNEPVTFSFHDYEDIYFSTPSISGQVNTLYQLNKILVSFGGKVQKEINFDYALSTSQRLQLSKVKEKGSDNYFANTYSFFYNNSTALPGYGEGKSDHWGYFNNQYFFASVAAPYDYTNLSTYPNYRTPSLTHSQAEILNKVVYPTGGYIEMEYQLNTYSKSKNSFTVTDHGATNTGGGLRISKLKYYSGDNILASETEYDYAIPGSSVSSGVLAIPPNVYLSGNSVSYNFKAGGYNPVYYQGNTVTYTYVTEKQVGNGKTVYEHTNYDNGYNDVAPLEINNASWYWRFDYAYANKAFKRGKPITVKRYRESGPILTESSFHYEHENPETNKDEVRSLYMSVFTANNYYASITERIYPNHLISKEEKTYNTNGNIVEKQSTVYDAYGNLKESMVFDSRGKVVKEKYKYNYEYPSTGTDNISLGIKFLNDLGIKNALVEKVSILENTDGSNSHVTSASLLTYRTNAAFLDKNYVLHTSAPFSQASFVNSNISGSSFVRDSRYIIDPEVEANSYDSKGNILQTTALGGLKKGYIWDYSGLYLVAECTNSLLSDMAYTSFEADGNGNWTIGSTARYTQEGFTGARSYQLSSGNITKAGLNAGLAYTISLWVKNADPGITGSNTSGVDIAITSWITRKTADGWRLIECSATGVNSITLSGSNSIVDELRLCPKNGTMTSYTYEPLVGIASKSDGSNYVSFYEYDEFNRLVIIKDQDKNILKTYCYNYAGQSENCNVYYSEPASGDFSVPCPTGIGSTVTYHVPAKKYLSTHSQQAANLKAAADVAANGQAYATANGTCTPVYVRLERTQDYSYQDPYTHIESTSYVVRFYSNPAGTIPLALPGNLNVNYYHYQYQQSPWYFYEWSHNGSMPGEQGYTEYEFGYTELIYCTYDPPFYYDCVNNSITLTGGNYIIIN